MDAQEILLRAGVKPTPNRILVMRVLLSAEGPLGLAELEEALPSIEKSSIFRVLSLFGNRHLLHVIEDGRGLAKYEVCHSDDDIDDDMHPHFYCTECRKVFCIHSIGVPSVDLPDGFEAQSVNYMIKGLCPVCSAKK